MGVKQKNAEEWTKVDPATADSWDLVVYTNACGYRTDLPSKVQDDVMAVTWELQDGYGERGYTPVQGWDWSGIRDSTERGKRLMVMGIRRVLVEAGISSFRVQKAW